MWRNIGWTSIKSQTSNLSQHIIQYPGTKRTKSLECAKMLTNCQLNPPYTPTHTHLTALFPGLSGWAGTRKVKPIWILLKQETVSGSGISWAIYKSAPCSRQITTPAPHHSFFYRPDALPAAQPTASKHWRQQLNLPYLTKIRPK